MKTSLSECYLDDRGLLHFRQRIWIPENEALRTGIIQKIHNSYIIAYLGRDATYSILSRRFFWPGAAKDVRRFLRNCTVCGRSSVWRDTKHRLLKLLPIPQRIWAEISVDFITGLPPSGSTEATNCMVITDRLTKGVILIGIRDTTAEDITQAFFTHFYIYHGLPLAIVSDRGPQFVSAFWRKVYERLSIQRRLSTAFHPQGLEKARAGPNFQARAQPTGPTPGLRPTGWARGEGPRPAKKQAGPDFWARAREPAKPGLLSPARGLPVRPVKCINIRIRKGLAV